MNKILKKPWVEGEMPGILHSVWPLLFGIGLLMLGNGLQGTLLGIRAQLEGFRAGITGLIMASYYVGFMASSVWTPRVMQTVGHIRVFAALSAIGSGSILAHVLIIDPFFWGFLRFLMGFCFAGIFVVTESWLNDRSTVATRGRLLAIYMGVTFTGMGGGQFLLNLSPPESADLFILVSILISVSVVPLLLSAKPIPNFEAPRLVSLRRIYTASPMGTVGTFVAGLSNGVIFAMGAVYAKGEGFTVSETALFMGAIIAGAAALQWPVGRLSDIFDRRRVILGSALLAGLAALGVELFSGISDGLYYTLLFLMGGLSLAIHSLSLAYTNDYLEQDELIGASSMLVLVLGVGSVLGPIMVGVLLAQVGSSSFFYFLAILHFGLVAYVVWRMNIREALPAEEQAPYVAVPLQGSDISAVYSEEKAEEEGE